MMKPKSLFAATLALFLANVALAASSPTAMLQSATSSMIAALEKDQSRLRSNPGLVSSHVSRIVLPHMDVDNMSRAVIGKTAWTAASADQRSEFTRRFQSLVISTYSAALSEYDDQVVEYAPIRGGYQGKRFVQVNSVIKQKSGPNIRVNYRLVLHGNTWKVYDFSVDGISMVQSYRSQFSPILKKHGMAGVLAKLNSRSR